MLCSIAVLFLVLVGTGVAQTITTGQLAGVVTDSAGASVPKAQVNLANDNNGQVQSASTNDAGEFTFPLLPPGPYTLSVSAPGFEKVTQKATVSLGQSGRVNIQLGVAQQSTTVEVSEQAQLVQSDNANLSTTFNSQQLENLPAPGNDITAYAFTAPGVTISTGSGYGNFSAFGLPGVSNLFTINGNDNMDPYLNLNNSGASNLTLGSNEISEASVVLNGYTGQYGRQAGANVNYVTKSGTNQFHGNAGWQYNGRVMNANDWFNNANGDSRPFSVSNEWVASFGGPIIKDKVFGFIDNEGLRYVLANSNQIYVPTQNFSNYVLNSLASSSPSVVPFYRNIFNLYGNSTGKGRTRDLNASDDPTLGCGSFSNNIFGSGGQPCAATFRSAVNNLNTEWLLAARVDYNPTSKDRFYFRYNTDHGVQATGTDAINPAFNANSVQPSYGGQAGWTRVISSTMVNQLLASATYYTAIFGPPNLQAALQVFPTTLTFTDGAPFSNLGGSDNSYPQGRKVRQWQLVDDYSINLGRHTVKFGLNARKNFISTYAYGSNTSGLFTFNDMNDFVTGNLATTGNSTYSQAFSSVGAQSLTLYSVGFYGQDEWKVLPNLTLTLALRMDRNSNIQCATGCFNELLGQPFAQAAHGATIPYNASIRTGIKEAFPSVEPIVPEPRVGFAWNVKPSTVVRGGFGIFSDLYQGLIADRLITNSPTIASFTTATGLVAPGVSGSAFGNVANSNAAFRNGFASGQTVSQLQASVPGFKLPNFSTVSNKLYNPKYYEWNFELQQGFLNKFLVSLNYVGNHGYQEINQTVFGNEYSAKGFVGLPRTAPDPRFGQIQELNNNGWSNYNGLVSSLRWHASNNFSGQVSYTWSHALDTCSNACLEPFNAGSAPSLRMQISPLGLRALNYGNSDYDVRHSLNANYVYTLPNSHFQNGILKQVLGGWTIAGTFFYHSGYPFSVLNTGVRGAQGVVNATGLRTQSVLADYIGSASAPSCTTPNVACYSSSLFAKSSAQNNFGNLTRNSFRGPGYFDTDVNVNKTFSIHERFKLLVGAYLFNVLNHPNFDLPVNNLASGNFGFIQNTVSAPSSAYGSFQGSAVSGRVIQSQVKLTF